MTNLSTVTIGAFPAAINVLAEVAGDGAALGSEPKAGGGCNVLIESALVVLGHIIVPDVARTYAIWTRGAKLAGKQIAHAILAAKVRGKGRRDSSVRSERAHTTEIFSAAGGVVSSSTVRSAGAVVRAQLGCSPALVKATHLLGALVSLEGHLLLALTLSVAVSN